jgi:non-heme chloroperoxidase
MSFVTTKDRVESYCKDWGSGPPIVFSHGWPLSADDSDAQIMLQTADGHDLDHYVDDLATVTAHVDQRTPFMSAIQPEEARSSVI